MFGPPMTAIFLPFVVAAFNHALVFAVTLPTGPIFSVPGGLGEVRLT